MAAKIVVLILAAVACCVYADEEVWHFPGHDFDRTPLGDAIDRASMKFLKEAYSQEENKNVVASPLGVLLLLSLYSEGTIDQNREEITKALGAANYSQLHDSYTRLSQKFADLDPNYFTLANKVYVAKKYDLAENFLSRAVGAYRSEVESIDFGDNVAAAANINKWADEKTKGHIKDPVDKDAIDSDVAAALFNVIFFQGHWNVPFNVSNTEDKDFHVDRSTVVKKPTMHLQQSLFYQASDDLKAKLVELPYKEQGFRMVIVLPDEVDGLPHVIEKVAQKGLLTDIFSLQPANAEVYLDLPKFDIKSSLNLNKLLPKVGVSRIFTDGAPGIVKGDSVVVSKAFQEAFVKVDEEGATAGAFTGLVAVTFSSLSEPRILELKVDHPFLFAILHEDTIIFTGTYTK